MPNTIKIANILVIICYVFLFMGIAIAIITISYKSTSFGFWYGYQNELAQYCGAQSLNEYTDYHAGRLLGMVTIPLVYYTIIGLGLFTRRFLIVVVSTSTFIFLDLISFSVPLLKIIILILACSNSGKTWLKRKNELKYTAIY